jgi:arginine deiminase
MLGSAHYGVSTDYGNLRRVMIHRPGKELEQVRDDTLKHFGFMRPVDPARFTREYDAMLAILTATGAEAVELCDALAGDAEALALIEARPNMTYLRDLSIVLRTGAVIMRPALPGRLGEEQIVRRAYEQLGVPVVGEIAEPGTLEGGGIARIADDTLVVSDCDRANQSGLDQFRQIAFEADPQLQRLVVVPLEPGHIHIDGVFLTLDRHLALAYEPSLQWKPSLVYQRGRTEPHEIGFLDLLAELEVEVEPLDEEEWRGGHLNLVITDRGKRAIGFAAAHRLAERLAKRGWSIETFASDELWAGNGGAHCMTCPLLVEP